jgi:hypothetical protein
MMTHLFTKWIVGCFRKLTGNDVLVIGPGAVAALKSSRASIAEFLQAGGHAVTIGLDQTDAAFLPVNIATKTQEYITAAFDPFPVTSPLRGVGPADLDNRDPRNIPLLASGPTRFGTGVLGVANDANLVFCQLVPWQFDYEKQYNLKRTYRRVSFAVVRLLANAGIAAPTPILPRFAAPVVASKPESRWLDGLYIDTPEEWDDPYRFFCW